MWPSYARILQEANSSTSTTVNPILSLLHNNAQCVSPSISRVHWFLDASAFLKYSTTITTTTATVPGSRAAVQQWLDRVALHSNTLLMHNKVGGGATSQLVLAFDRAPLLPLHMPLPSSSSSSPGNIITTTTTTGNDQLMNLTYFQSALALEHVSGTVAESIPVLHWQWMQYMTSHLQCPAGMKKLAYTWFYQKGLPTDENQYKALLMDVKQTLHKSTGLFAREMQHYEEKLTTCAVHDFKDRFAAHVVAQQLPLSSFAWPSIDAPLAYDTPQDTLGSVMTMQCSAPDLLAAQKMNKRKMAAESMGQLLPFVVAALRPALAAPPTTVTILSSPGRADTLALCVIALAQKYLRTAASLANAANLPEGACFLFLDADRNSEKKEHVLMDIGAFYNHLVHLCQTTLSASTHLSLYYAVVTWAISALLSQENAALSNALWTLQSKECAPEKHHFLLWDTHPPSAFNVRNAARWLSNAWDRALMPLDSSPSSFRPLMLQWNAVAQHVTLVPPGLQDVELFLYRLFTMAVERLPVATTHTPLYFMTIVYERATSAAGKANSLLGYTVQKVKTGDAVAQLLLASTALNHSSGGGDVVSNAANVKQRFYIQLEHGASNVPSVLVLV